MGSGRRLLARSDHYTVSSEYEIVLLERPAGPAVVIGDHYGDPVAAVIDWKERWCVTVGCGLILYWLREPFLSYEYNVMSPQWLEVHRLPPEEWWIEAVYHVDDDTVRFVVDPSSNHAGLYELRVEGGLVVTLISK